MNRDELFGALAAHRSNLVDRLEPLTDDQWNAPSLCDGWKVRHVVGHLVSLQAVPTWRFVLGAAGMSGFHRKVDRFAREFGDGDRPGLLSQFRGFVPSRKAPPRIGPMAPLMDVMVHSLDISKPLGLPAIHESGTARVVLDAMSRGFPVMAPSARTNGLRFEADDLDWSAGQGPVVRGTAGDVALAISGRLVAIDDLVGDGVSILRSRLSQ